MKQLQQQLKHAQTPAKGTDRHKSSLWDQKSGELNSVESVLNAYVPEKEREEVRRILFGRKAEALVLPEGAHEIAKKLDFELAGYRIPAQAEELRHPRIVRIGAI